MISDIKKTKIICTIGPASSSPSVIRELIKSGMNVARLNFSHGDLDEHSERIKLIREAAKELDVNVSILQDLPGPKIRIGNLDKEQYKLETGSKVLLSKKDIIGNDTEFSCSHPEVVDSLIKGDFVFINDGLIKLVVVEKKKDSLLLEVLNEGSIRSHKGMNIPSQNLNIAAITDEDIEFLKFGIKMDLDFIAASFIKHADDILKLKDIISESKKDIKVIAKIENPEAIKNIDEILSIADGLMVARGDLGIEVPIEEIALKQKFLIDKARTVSKPSIVATQMLRSMVDYPTPTRAEVSDITNAILDGADAVMLSEETAIGKYAIDACATMARICVTVEKEIKNLLPFKHLEKNIKIYPELALSFAAERITEDLNVKAIVVLTRSGKTARLISERRIDRPILAFTTDKKVVKHLNLCWGVIPYYLEEINDKNVLTKMILDLIKVKGLLPEGSLILLTCGTPNNMNISTNMLELLSI
jgi:pyruvate kinase